MSTRGMFLASAFDRMRSSNCAFLCVESVDSEGPFYALKSGGNDFYFRRFKKISGGPEEDVWVQQFVFF